MGGGILYQLEQNRTAVLAALDGITDTQAAAAPDGGGWSALDCMEHVIAVEKRFFALLARAERLSDPRVEHDREAALAERLRNRQTKVEAPDAVLPTGRFTAVVDAISEFSDARDRVIRFAEKNEADLYHLSATHAKFGVLNGVEILLFICGHAARHADQIRSAVGARGASA